MSPEALIGLAAAPFVGSFLGLVIDRLPAGRPILFGRSVCDGCAGVLDWIDLVPLLSFLHLRGHCRRCRQPLSAFYPLVELAAVAIVASAALVLSGGLFWLSVALGWCLLVLAAIDQRHMILPDELTLPLIPAGLGVAWLVDPGAIGDHVIGSVAGFAAFAGMAWLYRMLRGREGLGLGDAKLMAGAGAWLGWSALPGVMLLAACTALFLALLRSCRSAAGAASMTRYRSGLIWPSPFWMSWLLGPLTLA